MGTKKTTALWRSATKLETAWHELAPLADQAAYEAALAAVRTPQLLPGPETSGLIVRAAFGFAQIIAAQGAVNGAELKLKAALVERVAAGEFELLAYRDQTPRREPVLIRDLDLRKYPPDWNIGTLNIHGDQYVDVKVSPAIARATGIKRGRRGAKEAILATIDELIAASGPAFCALPRDVACTQIINHPSLAHHNKDIKGSGFSSPNLMKLIQFRCGFRSGKID